MTSGRRSGTSCRRNPGPSPGLRCPGGSSRRPLRRTPGHLCGAIQQWFGSSPGIFLPGPQPAPGAPATPPNRLQGPRRRPPTGPRGAEASSAPVPPPSRLYRRLYRSFVGASSAFVAPLAPSSAPPAAPPIGAFVGSGGCGGLLPVARAAVWRRDHPAGNGSLSTGSRTSPTPAAPAAPAPACATRTGRIWRVPQTWTSSRRTQGGGGNFKIVDISGAHTSPSGR